MPTTKQKQAVKVVINGGTPSEGMKEANYAPSVVRNPQVLTESKGWKELVDQYIPDKDLAKVHKEGLKAKRFIAETQYQEAAEVPDYSTRHKFLESGYKLKGKFPKETGEGDNTNIFIKEISIKINKYLP